MNARVAIPYEQGQIFPHFGKAVQFKIYAIEDSRVVSSEVCETGGIGHEELGLWLIQHEVNAVVCDGIGPGAQGALLAAGIEALAGVGGKADAAVARLLDGTLEATGVATCGGHAGGCGGGCSAGRCGGCGMHG